MTWSDMRREYAAEVIGPLILGEARRAVQTLSRRYDPEVYARTASWADAIDDTVQQLVVDLLIGDGQIDYMMSVARDLEAFRALMALQVKRLLARTRTRTVVDNLIDRARALIGVLPLEQHVRGRRPDSYSLPGAEPRGPSRDEVWRAARNAALIPRVGVGRSERAPLVYADRDLRALLLGVATDLACQFSLGDLDSILRLVLTDLLPSFLESDEWVHDVRAQSLTAEEVVVVAEAVQSVLTSLDDDQRMLVRDKLAGLSDAEMAKTRGISRPTLAARKQAVFAVLGGELRDLERTLQEAAIDRLGMALASGEVRS